MLLLVDKVKVLGINSNEKSKNLKFSKLCDTDWTLGIQKLNKVFKVFKPIAPENNTSITKWKNHFPKMVEFFVMCRLMKIVGNEKKLIEN